MRAVNLLPSDLRGAAPKPARGGSRPEPVQGIGAYVVLGALALCVAALASYVVVTNGVKQREADLATAKQRTAVATAKANELRPYADFETLATARVETVRGLAAARFDWERSLRDLSRAMPSDVKLQSLTGDIGLPGASSGGGTDPLRGSISAPAITLAGCASSQTGVARMMSRVRAVQGVTRVSLSKSESLTATAPAAGTEAPCGTGRPPSFSVVVFFEGAPSSAALAPQTETGAQTNVPVPNAIEGGKEPADGAEGAAEGAAATDTGGAAATTTSTTTSTGGTE
jgi:Tfp pilus assembly protein PilN